jgi:hypothetical protein
MALMRGSLKLRLSVDGARNLIVEKENLAG